LCVFSVYSDFLMGWAEWRGESWQVGTGTQAFTYPGQSQALWWRQLLAAKCLEVKGLPGGKRADR
jgi:hypothetical protein